MAFRFLHLGDVHLGTSFGSRNEVNRNELKKSLCLTMDAVATLAVERQAHAVLIAGDLLDSARLEYRDELFMKNWIDKLARQSIPIFYSPGNHDPLTMVSMAGDKPQWPSGFTVFGEEPLSVTVFDRDGKLVGRVCGIAHKNEAVNDNLALLFPVNESGSVPSVALLHALLVSAGGAANHDRYAPCSLADLEIKGHHYWALGHVHGNETVHGRTIAAYSGCLMGRSFHEPGHKGCYFVEIRDDNSVDAEFIPLALSAFHVVEIDMTNIREMAEIERIIRSAQNLYGTRALYLRLIMKGNTDLYDMLTTRKEALESDLCEVSGLALLELKTDALLPSVKPDAFRGESHVLSTSLSLLEKAMEDPVLLNDLLPEDLRGLPPQAGPVERAAYAKKLLDKAEYELVRLFAMKGTGDAS